MVAILWNGIDVTYLAAAIGFGVFYIVFRYLTNIPDSPVAKWVRGITGSEKEEVAEKYLGDEAPPMKLFTDVDTGKTYDFMYADKELKDDTGWATTFHMTDGTSIYATADQVWEETHPIKYQNNEIHFFFSKKGKDSIKDKKITDNQREISRLRLEKLAINRSLEERSRSFKDQIVKDAEYKGKIWRSAAPKGIRYQDTTKNDEDMREN